MDYNYIYCALIGIAIGGVIGFLIGSHSASHEFEEVIESDYKDISDLKKELNDTKNKYETLVERYSFETGTDSLIRKAKEAKEVEDEEEEEEEPEKNMDICRITSEEAMDEFDNGVMSWNVMTYYQGDGVLADYDDEKITDISKYLGEEVTEEIDTTDDNVIYVLNNPRNSIYEVTIEHEAEYYKDVLGLE